jgi:hypothetical protein|tara:strand:- start:569 stop:730 length:162 start_codon:yes stop_codon:yes gene_type:complete
MKFNNEELNVLYEALCEYTCGQPVERDLIARLEVELDITWHIEEEIITNDKNS